MRYFAAFLVFLLMTHVLPAEERKTKSDFIPPPPPERALTETFPRGLSPKTGLWISSAGVLTGLTLSLVTTHNTFNRALDDPGSRNVQRGVVLTGACLIGTAVCMVLTDFFLEEIRKSKKATSEE